MLMKLYLRHFQFHCKYCKSKCNLLDISNHNIPVTISSYVLVLNILTDIWNTIELIVINLPTKEYDIILNKDNNKDNNINSNTFTN